VTQKDAAALEALMQAGWHIKIMSDTNGPTPKWRCWVSWRRGQMPHREESTKVATLKEAAAWVQATAEEFE
jgi:hypothetical protein